MHFFKIIGLLVSFFLITASGQASNDFGFIEGVHYKKLTEKINITPYKKQVTEIFYYGCPHCYHLELSLNEWLKNKHKDINFVRMPAVLNNQNWIFMARVYYTAVILGIEKQFHPAYFKAVQGDKKAIFDLDSLAKFVEPMGIAKEKYKQIFKSFKVGQLVQQAKVKTDIYGASGVPAVIINGKYLTSVGMATSRKKLWELVNHLVNR